MQKMMRMQTGNVEDQDDQSDSLPNEYLQTTITKVERQKLMTLRLEILYMRDNFADVRRNKCILSTR